MDNSHFSKIATRLGVGERGVAAIVGLLADGATIPFIARYRKERTGGLDEVQINLVRKEAERLEEFDNRRLFILSSLEKEGLLSDTLKAQLDKAETMSELEDIYLPFKPKKKTRAQVAKEAGLEPFAKMIMTNASVDLQSLYRRFKPRSPLSFDNALKGASDIIAEWLNESKAARDIVRKAFKKAFVSASLVKGKEGEAEKYRNYFNFNRPMAKCTSHHYLALRRAEASGLLKVTFSISDEETVGKLERLFIKPGLSTEGRTLIREAVKDGFRRLLRPSIETEISKELKQRADDEAIEFFVENLRQLLMAPPAGKKRILGLDPGFRTGCKVAAIDEQGNLLTTDVIFPCAPFNRTEKSKHMLLDIIDRYSLNLIAVGDGTASRETVDFLKINGFEEKARIEVVSESGASVYSASECARREFPELDVSYRGTVSIARRVLDPLAELVKIDPKSIGVGQYQHDVDQNKLRDGLDFTVERCVNAVGVDLNTASPELLSRVAGIGPVLAEKIVDYRAENGPFAERKDLLKVPRLGAKTYEQCAAFLRIPGGRNPLDNTGIHPERYALVGKMAKSVGLPVESIIRDFDVLKNIDLQAFIDENTGMATLTDIIEELKKPGRDPRVIEADNSVFSQNIKEIGDLFVGLELKGKVVNITAFGAFVNIGLKESGLVHVSQLSDRFVSKPGDVVSLGDIVNVRVIDVDLERKRIGLSMKGF